MLVRKLFFEFLFEIKTSRDEPLQVSLNIFRNVKSDYVYNYIVEVMKAF